MLKAPCVCLFSGFAVTLTQLMDFSQAYQRRKNHYSPTCFTCFLNKMCPGGGGSCNSLLQRDTEGSVVGGFG